jgi:hypothetical protein
MSTGKITSPCRNFGLTCGIDGRTTKALNSVISGSEAQ